MNRKLSILSLSLALCASALAQTGVPNFKSWGATGTSSAEIIVPADPYLQCRLLSVTAQSDKAGSLLKLSTGLGAYNITLSNAAGTTITCAVTNGLNANDILIVQSANGSTNASATISSISNTNITLAAAVFQTLPGDQVYKMGTVTSLPVGATTNWVQNGEAIFVGTKGRPIRVLLDGTSAVTINNLTGLYQ